MRQQQDKLFYVSPFIEMAMRYHFRVLPPGERVKLRILETDREGPLLAATFNGRRRALDTTALLRAFFALPLVTLKIMAAIHWEALRLWLKGARLVPRHGRSRAIPRLATAETQRLYFARVVRPRQSTEAGPIGHAKVRVKADVRWIAHARVDFGHIGNRRRDCFRNCPAWSGWRWVSAHSCSAARST